MTPQYEQPHFNNIAAFAARCDAIIYKAFYGPFTTFSEVKMKHSSTLTFSGKKKIMVTFSLLLFLQFQPVTYKDFKWQV